MRSYLGLVLLFLAVLQVPAEGLKASEDLKRAERYYAQMVRTDPTSEDAWKGLAVALRRSEQLLEARAAMEQALRLHPSAINHREVGLLLRMLGEEDLGIAHLQRSVEQGAISSTAMLLIGRWLHSQSRLEEAISCLKAALRLTDEPLRGGHAVALTMAFLSANRLPEARDAYRGAATDPLFISDGHRTALNPALGVTAAEASRITAQQYLAAKMLAAAGARLEAGTSAQDDSKALQGELEELQSGRSCAGSPLLMYALSGANGGVGLGCEFHGLALALAAAYRQGRTLVLAPTRWWLAGAACPGGRDGDASGFECFFRPLSRCEAGDSADVVEFTPGSDPFSDEQRFWVPPRYASRGLLWFRGQLARYLFKPKRQILDGVDRRGVWCGVHLRRGDKNTEIQLNSVKAYADAVLALQHATDLDRSSQTASSGVGSERVVIIVSDEVGAPASLVKELASGGQLQRELVVQDVMGNAIADRDGADGWLPRSRSGHLVRDFQDVDIANLTASSIRDLWALSKASHLVAAFSSNFARLAYELAHGRQAGVVPNPPVSLDVLWHDPH